MNANPDRRIAKADLYRTLFLCELEQLSAFSFGGSESSSNTDMDVAVDGAGSVRYRGSSLAGALLATARTFLEVPRFVSRGFGGDDKSAPGSGAGAAFDEPPSIVCVDHAIPVHGAGQCTPRREPRAGNRHVHAGRVGDTGGLFDFEVLPKGLRWRFLIDVDHAARAPEDGASAAGIVALVLREWQRERCWLGRRVARGLGWMRLAECSIVLLPRTEDYIDRWPNAEPASIDARHGLVRTLMGGGAGFAYKGPAALDDYLADRGTDLPELRPRRIYVRWQVQAVAGPYMAPDADGKSRAYGLDALSIGGHGSAMVPAEAIQDRWVRVAEQRWDRFAAGCEPDTQLAFTHAYGTAGPAPVLQASGVAGALRHWQARGQRAAGESALDPSTGVRYSAAGPAAAGPDISSELFGAMEKGGHPSRLLLRDGHLEHGQHDCWRIALLEKLALDEFRQSALDSVKYDRLAILQGRWTFDLVQEVREAAPGEWMDDAKCREAVGRAIAPVQAWLAAGARREIGFGGGEFRAYGHLELVVRAPVSWALAGHEWAPWDDGGDHRSGEATA